MAKNEQTSTCWVWDRLLTFLRLFFIRHSAPQLTLQQLRWKSTSEADVSSIYLSDLEKRWKNTYAYSEKSRNRFGNDFHRYAWDGWNHYIRQTSLVSKPKCKHENYGIFKDDFNLKENMNSRSHARLQNLRSFKNWPELTFSLQKWDKITTFERKCSIRPVLDDKKPETLDIMQFSHRW